MIQNQKHSQPDESCNLSLVQDAVMALEKLGLQEARLVQETEDLFKRQVDTIKSIDDLANYTPVMSKIEVDTEKLASLVDSSSSLVEDVCRKVRKIDVARARLEECLAKVGDILDLKACREGVQNAMRTDNYEEASIHIKRFLSIDQEQLRKTLAIISGRDPASQLKKSNLIVDVDDLEKLAKSPAKEDEQMLDPAFVDLALAEIDEVRGKLVKLCQTNIDRAIKEENPKEIERYFKLFPILNEHSEGLNRYASYLRGRILNPLNDEGLRVKKANHADKLAALYESIAQIVDSNQPLVETYYGPGHLIDLISHIQEECDILSRKILEEFRNETKLQYVAKIVRNSSMQRSQTNTVNLTPSKLEPGDIDNILNEITLIISRSEVYLNFIVQRIKDDIDSKCEDDSQRQACLLRLYNLVCIECELNQLIQEVGGIYVMLEQYYLNESAKKAILMDQVDMDSTSCVMSSMLDDIFFIIKKCTKRATSTKSNEVFCAIINHCVTLLESTFCQFLEEKLRNQQYYSTAFTGKNLDLSQAYNAIQSGRYLQSTDEFEISKAQYFSALNNLDKACDYLKTLRGFLDADIKKLKPSLVVIEKQQSTKTIDKSATCLNELSQLVHRFTSIINSSLYQLFNSLLRNRVGSELKALMTDNPDLARIVARNPEELLPLARNLLITLDRSLKDGLTQENYSKLVSITGMNIKSLM